MGVTIVPSRPSAVDAWSMRKYTKTFGSFVPKRAFEATVGCIECVDSEVVTVELINQRCAYYPECTRGDHCWFLHEEEPIAFATYEEMKAAPPQKRTFTVSKTVRKKVVEKVELTVAKEETLEVDDAADVRVYVSNVPGKTTPLELRRLVGMPVEDVKLLRSSMANGRKAGFVHMTSKRAAEQAVALLNRTTLSDAHGEAHILAKIQAIHALRPTSVPKPASAKPKPKSRRRVVIIDDDGFTLVGSNDAKPTCVSQDTPSTTHTSGTIFDALALEDTDGPPPLEPIATPMLEAETTPDTVIGLWHDVNRLVAVKSSPLSTPSTEKGSSSSDATTPSGLVPRLMPKPFNLLPRLQGAWADEDDDE